MPRHLLHDVPPTHRTTLGEKRTRPRGISTQSPLNIFHYGPLTSTHYAPHKQLFTRMNNADYTQHMSHFKSQNGEENFNLSTSSLSGEGGILNDPSTGSWGLLWQPEPQTW